MFERIVNWIEVKFGVEGLLHVIICKLIVDVCEIFMPLWVALLIGILAGLFKEFVVDKWMGKGTFDKKDLLADGMGIVLGLI